jgi:hypothetical protein
LDLVDPGIVEEEALQIKCFQAWLAWKNLLRRIEDALEQQQHLDNLAVCRKTFRAWKQVAQISGMRKKDRMMRSSVTQTPLKDMDDVFTPVATWTGSVLNMAAHRKAVGAKLLVDVRQTLCCRVALVAWRAMVAVQQVIMRGPEGQAQILAGGGRGWSAQQWQHRILSTWTPQRIMRKFFSEWQFYVQRKIRRAIRRKMMLKSGVRLLPRMEKPREQLLLAKVFNKWGQHVWLIHADAVFQYERESMQRSFQIRLMNEQQRARMQNEAVSQAMEELSSDDEARAAKAADTQPDEEKKKFRLPSGKGSRASSARGSNATSGRNEF